VIYEACRIVRALSLLVAMSCKHSIVAVLSSLTTSVLISFMVTYIVYSQKPQEALNPLVTEERY
jgi:hypothetical protein